VYDIETSEEIGRWNEETRRIEVEWCACEWVSE
jgi:hypothetical protein